MLEGLWRLASQSIADSTGCSTVRVRCGGSCYTIPTRVRVGWYFGTSRFESEGEFFRATIEDAIFR
jgi:hypothetical protein